VYSVEYTGSLVHQLHQDGASMSFLFGKKSKEGKGQNAPPQRPAEAQSGVGPSASIPTLNGARSKERGPGVISPPPGESVNNSANSVEDATTPSPEQKQGLRGRLDSDLQVCYYCATSIPHTLFIRDESHGSSEVEALARNFANFHPS